MERISDVLYGTFELENSLTALIDSQEIQRLKDVHMAGPAFLVNPKWNETRYEHSLGVMLLIRKLGGSIEEQLAGLLHDVSHTAFSHVVDVAFANQEDNYHEQIKAEMLQRSSIPVLLEMHGFDYKHLALEDEKWTLLEQEAPLLCCDRIDYTLREVYRYFDVPLEEIHQFLKQLIIIDGKIITTSIQWAEWFIDQYKKIVIDFFYDPRNILSYEWLGRMITIGIDAGDITTSDLLLTDSAFLQKMKESDLHEIQALLKKLTSKFNYKICSSEEEYDLFQKKKMRLVDPLVLVGGKIQPVSMLSDQANEKIKRMRELSEYGIYLKSIE